MGDFVYVLRERTVFVDMWERGDRYGNRQLVGAMSTWENAQKFAETHWWEMSNPGDYLPEFVWQDDSVSRTLTATIRYNGFVTQYFIDAVKVQTRPDVKFYREFIRFPKKIRRIVSH